MKRIFFALAWIGFRIAFWLADKAKDGVGEADEWKVGGTD